MTDRELLQEYRLTGSDEALAGIVQRHAAAVYATCLRVLADPGEAEDAAQAAFLVFARKGRSLPASTVLAGWFFRTAELAARDARKIRERRARREREAAMIRDTRSERAPAWEDLRPELDSALAALPARQQEALVLRYLHGKSEKEVCAELGAPQSTVATRIAGALEKLRSVLARRGVTASAAALGGLLSAHAAPAAPAGLVASITAACAGGAAASASAVSLAGGVAKAMTLAKVKLAAVYLAVAGVVAGGGGTALHAISRTRAEQVWVAPDFTPNPDVTRILESLGEGCSAELPPVKTAGELNAVARKYDLDQTGPCGRNYTIKMVWMPDRRRAIFTGANHRKPHRLNDVWEYDLPSNTWVCLYGPDDLGVRSGWDRVGLEDGVLRTPRGGPAIIGNGEWQVTYVPDIGAMAFRSLWGIHSREVRERFVSRSKHRPELWYFFPGERRREPQNCRKPAPGGIHGTYIEYLPTAGRIAWFSSAHQKPGMWLLDPRTLKSETLLTGETFRPRNNPDVPAGDGVAAYCPGRKLLVVAGRDRSGGVTCHYDVESRKWTRTASGPEVPAGHMSFTPCGYDANAGVMLLYDQRGRVLSAYDPAARRWSAVTPEGPPPPSGPVKVFGYYDPARNVFVLCQNAKVWLYRHRHAPLRGVKGEE
ncbi:MAG: RNA polymerase sigma factor [Planctomycetota bacterium]|jgi:RNA polymerase sigma factor (sigma-70 family)